MKENKSFFQKLINKYRLVVLNDDTLEEKLSFRLSRLNVFFLLSTIFVSLFIIFLTLIIVTPLKLYIPGYGDQKFRQNLEEINHKVDSFTYILNLQDRYLTNVRNILNNNIEAVSNNIYTQNDSVDYSDINLIDISSKDSLIRAKVEDEMRYSLSGIGNEGQNALKLLNFISPVNGFVTNEFDVNKEHFGIDLVSDKDASIVSVLPGTVIVADYTLNTGWVIAVQHEDNFISFYKHNSVLFKKVGNFVSAGEAIAIIGNSGELSTGPHLHFELWKDQKPVNPLDFINFN